MMEEAKGVVKHVLLAKFKDDISPDKIEELIKAYADLVNHIQPMKAFQWYTRYIFFWVFLCSCLLFWVAPVLSFLMYILKMLGLCFCKMIFS